MLSSSDDEDEDLHSTDPESREKSKDKRPLCKVKWSRDEVGDHPNPSPQPSPGGPGCGPLGCGCGWMAWSGVVCCTGTQFVTVVHPKSGTLT